jgi:hypothetical protein
MKNILLILLLILAFAGCKDDEQVEPDAVVYEDWTKIPSSVISLNTRWVLTLEAYDTNLYIQCLQSFYHLDQNLARKAHYLTGFDKEPRGKGPVIGNRYTIKKHNESWGSTRFNICFTNDPLYDDFWLNYDSISRPMTGAGNSNIDDEGNFGILYSKEVEEDSISIYFDSYKVTGRWQEPAARVDNLFLVKTSNTQALVSDVVIIDDVFYMSYYRNLARVENGNVTHSFPFNLRDIQKYGNALVGVADNIWRGMPDEPQLMISYDDGKSWSSVMKGRTLNSGNLKVVGEEILLIRGWYVLILDIENGEFKEVNMDGTDAYFSDVTKLGDKAILGTESGVYYKSWESFLNK